MKHQPRALCCNHWVFPSACVWSAPPWRAESRAAELLNYGSPAGSLTELFQRMLAALFLLPAETWKPQRANCWQYLLQRQQNASREKGTCSGACLFITRNEIMNIQNFLRSFYCAKFQWWGLQLFITSNPSLRQRLMKLKPLLLCQFLHCSGLCIFNLWPCLF